MCFHQIFGVDRQLSDTSRIIFRIQTFRSKSLSITKIMPKKICSNGNRRPIWHENWNGAIAIRFDGNIVLVKEQTKYRIMKKFWTRRYQCLQFPKEISYMHSKSVLNISFHTRRSRRFKQNERIKFCLLLLIQKENDWNWDVWKVFFFFAYNK